MSRSISGFVVAVAALTAPFTAYAAWQRWGEPSNAEIAASLPVYPGAKRVGRTDREFVEGSDIVLSYKLPRGVDERAVLRFYRAALGGDWDGPSEACTGFRRGDELVAMGVDVFDKRTLVIFVDNEGADSCDSYMGILAS